MYRLTVESLLGLHREGAVLRLTPHLPAAWSGCSISTATARRRTTSRFPAPRRARWRNLSLDGTARNEGLIPLVDDGQAHRVALRLEA